MTKDKLISYLKGCARLGRSDGVAYVRSNLLEEAIALLSGERQPNFTDPKWLDIPYSEYMDFARYITVTAHRVEGYDGVRVTVSEDLPKGARFMFYLPRGTQMNPEVRADFIKGRTDGAFRVIDDLFRDCDTPECPNCEGKGVKL